MQASFSQDMMILISPMLLLNCSFTSLTGLGKNIKPERPNLLVHRIDSPVRCMANTNVPDRKSANYQSNIWDYDFLLSLKNNRLDIRYEESSMKLREEVRRMIIDENIDIWTTLELIDDVKRLGLNYHFESEIAKVLDRFLSLEICNIQNTHINLHEAALSFRLLREYGYEVSADMFERFMDHNGNYEASLGMDVKGILSLYEASFLGYEGEEILDKAKDFTRFHLKVYKEDKKSTEVEKVSHALELPMHHRIQRMEARWYIDAYGRRNDANRVLLDAAKLDFNIVQLTLQKDLQEMLLWWKGMGLVQKISFGRDRLMECFFWTVGMVFEPEFSHVRKGLTKVACLITIIDDIYDVYGTFDELQLFTAAVESWDIKSIQHLPDYMKIFFLALYNTLNELAYDTLKDQGQYILPYLTKAWSDMLKAFLQEAKWCRDKKLPKFNDYLNNAWVSISGVVILIHAYYLLNHNITEETLVSLENYINLFRKPSIIFRLCNDLGTSMGELQRGEVANSIVCYMCENNVSYEDAYKHIHSLLDETWKKLNKDRVTYLPQFAFVEIATNLARISRCTYLHGDGHGAPDNATKNRIWYLIFEPIGVKETSM